ncbi:hypothetical protein PGTUg99_037153 [Puccinia graminis f. sp. tritici]|uniref:Uncharacterized protein n=1 Tax=Puccinia graminis f. sp. tritici TaxID=56615 RepID=A0A5B0S419_PUCGR|nr:hypothetical protein PGTUg99_037153 [Puccinia graminis f. sp. tritici]
MKENRPTIPRKRGNQGVKSKHNGDSLRIFQKNLSSIVSHIQCQECRFHSMYNTSNTEVVTGILLNMAVADWMKTRQKNLNPRALTVDSSPNLADGLISWEEQGS